MPNDFIQSTKQGNRWSKEMINPRLCGTKIPNQWRKVAGEKEEEGERKRQARGDIGTVCV